MHAANHTMEELAAIRCPNCRKDALEIREAAAFDALELREAADALAERGAAQLDVAVVDPTSCEEAEPSPNTIDLGATTDSIMDDVAIADTMVVEDAVAGEDGLYQRPMAKP